MINRPLALLLLWWLVAVMSSLSGAESTAASALKQVLALRGESYIQARDQLLLRPDIATTLNEAVVISPNVVEQVVIQALMLRLAQPRAAELFDSSWSQYGPDTIAPQTSHRFKKRSPQNSIPVRGTSEISHNNNYGLNLLYVFGPEGTPILTEKILHVRHTISSTGELLPFEDVASALRYFNAEQASDVVVAALRDPTLTCRQRVILLYTLRSLLDDSAAFTVQLPGVDVLDPSIPMRLPEAFNGIPGIQARTIAAYRAKPNLRGTALKIFQESSRQGSEEWERAAANHALAITDNRLSIPVLIHSIIHDPSPWVKALAASELFQMQGNRSPQARMTAEERTQVDAWFASFRRGTDPREAELASFYTELCATPSTDSHLLRSLANPSRYPASHESIFKDDETRIAD